MILALDYGERYIGIAAADPPDTPVHRYGTIDQETGNVMSHLQSIVQREGVKKILVGIPAGLSGNETEQTHKNLAFVERLREALGPGISVEGVDETLTSAEADRVLRTEGGDMSDQHAEAARLMLVNYLAQNLNN